MKNTSVFGSDFSIPELPKKPLPEYLAMDYDGSFEEFAREVYASVFWGRVNTMNRYSVITGEAIPKPREVDSKTWFNEIVGDAERKEPGSGTMITERLSAESHASAIELASRIKSKADMLMVRFIDAIRKNQMWKFSESESLYEFIMTKFPELAEGDSGERYEILFMVETILPMMERLGIDGRHLDKKTYSKLKNSVSTLRKAWKSYEEDVESAKIRVEKLQDELKKNKRRAEKATGAKREELLQTVEAIQKQIETVSLDAEKVEKTAEEKVSGIFKSAFSLIADPDVSSAGANGIRNILQRETQGLERKISFTGEMLIVPGKTVFVLEVPQKFESAVTAALRHFVDFHVEDGLNVIERLRKYLKGGA